MIENPLSNILIRPNVINERGLKSLINHIKNSKEEDLAVFDPEKTNKTGETKWKVDKCIRDTQLIPLGNTLPEIESLFKNIVKHIINPFYEFEVDSSEIPQILSYDIGGHYSPHIDGEAIWVTPKGEQIWKKSVDRDLSIILFINDEFEGGDLVFPELKIRIRPEPGMMICFPSNHQYIHGVEPVTKGKRYSIVTWATIKGIPSLEKINKDLSEKYGVPVT